MSKFGNTKTVIDGIACQTSRGQRGPAWTSTEIETLLTLRSQRRTIGQVAKALRRTPSAVENQWLRLRKRADLPRIRGNRIEDAAAHFWSRVDKSGGADACWRWTGKAQIGGGYGVLVYDMGMGRRNYGAHRVSFFLANGRPQGAGLEVLHSCDNKACCNPAHLSEGTRSRNMREAYERGLRSPQRRAGEDHHFARLTEDQVRAVRRLRAAGVMRKDLAELLNLSLGAIDNICSRRTWKGVSG